VPGLEVLLAVHDVDLLEGQRFGLVQEEVHHDAGEEVRAAEDKAEAVANAVGGVGGEEADHEVAWGVGVSFALEGLGRMDGGCVTYRASCLRLRGRLALLLCGEGCEKEGQSEASLLKDERRTRMTYKLSPMTTQAKGPQVMAKEAMNMQAATIITIPELSYSVGGRAIATEAKMSSHADCQRAP